MHPCAGVVSLFSYAAVGYHGHLVRVEVDCRVGIPGMDIVGLPASEVRESRERVRVGIRNSGLVYPSARILVSLSPAHIPKSGNGFDLAIAAGILDASHQTDRLSRDIILLGEVHLGGEITGVRGVLAALDEARGHGVRHAIVASENEVEARMVPGVRVAAVATLGSIPDALREVGEVDPNGATEASKADAREGGERRGDYAHLRGLADLKRALTVAAAGCHHLLVVGPPGGGKSAALHLLPTILPRLSRTDSVQVTRIRSLAGDRLVGLATHRPFRAPHHSASAEGLLGGRKLVPGEVALAHRGVLFLDEALEFRRPALQGLREPLEHGRIRVARAGLNYWFPASIQLIMATNRCPCGMLGRSDRPCLCSANAVEQYWRKLGGPLLDRIGIRLPVTPLPIESLPRTDSSADMRQAVADAIDFRIAARGQERPNSELRWEQVQVACALDRQTRAILSSAVRAFGLSTRGSIEVLRVARTIADLAGVSSVGEDSVLEAVSYRRFGEERAPWLEDQHTR